VVSCQKWVVVIGHCCIYKTRGYKTPSGVALLRLQGRLEATVSQTRRARASVLTSGGKDTIETRVNTGVALQLWASKGMKFDAGLTTFLLDL